MFQYKPVGPDVSRRKPRHPWVHLLWAVPLALPWAAMLVFLGAMSRWCGGGCQPGGPGRTPHDLAMAALFFAGSALTLAFPLCMVPWARRSIRFPVAAGLATIWFAYLLLA